MGSREGPGMIDVDGSLGEGGGQILRTAVVLASVLVKDVRVSKIRAGRSQPGIMAQHLAGVKAAAQLCQASLEGAVVGSSQLEYRPGRAKGGSFRFDVGTAGSVTLVLQVLMPVLAFAPEPSETQVTGGTDVRWSPPTDYLQLVTLPCLRRMGYDADLTLVRRGHYPRGGGEVHFSSTPATCLRGLVGADGGEMARIEGVSHATGLPQHVAERQAVAVEKILAERGLPIPNITLDYSQPSLSLSPGSGVVLCGTREDGAVLGADGLGERGKPAEEVGVEAGRRLIEEAESGAFLDRHMGDMIVPYMALAEGVSEVSVSQITQHTLTNVRVAELLAGVQFHVQGELGKRGVLRVKGLGLRSPAGSSSSTEAIPSPPP